MRDRCRMRTGARDQPLSPLSPLPPFPCFPCGFFAPRPGPAGEGGCAAAGVVTAEAGWVGRTDVGEGGVVVGVVRAVGADGGGGGGRVRPRPRGRRRRGSGWRGRPTPDLRRAAAQHPHATRTSAAVIAGWLPARAAAARAAASFCRETAALVDKSVVDPQAASAQRETDQGDRVPATATVRGRLTG